MSNPRILFTGPSPRGWHRLQTALECPQKFAWEYRYGKVGFDDPRRIALLSDKLKQAEEQKSNSPALVRGTLIHLGLAHYYARLRETQNGRDPELYLPPEDALRVFCAAQGSHHEVHYDEILACVKGYIEKYSVTDKYKILHVEEMFEAKIGNYQFTGRLDLATKLPHWLPARDKIAEAAGAFVEYARAGKSVGLAFLISIPAHLLMFSTFWFGAKAFAAGLNMLSVYCVMPIVATVTALPISVGGAGLREGLFIKILGALYSTPEPIATLVSLSGFMMQVFWSLIGGAIYLTYRSTERASLTEMETSVDDLEKRVEHNIEAGRPPEA